ncbi:MAG: tetratricopeptide repeat protein [Microcoleaceae cyanobacterium]
MMQNASKQDSQSRKRTVRVMTLIALGLFLTHTGYYMGKGLFSPPKKAPPPKAVTADANSRLKTQEQSYQTVLEQEPENQIALEKLLMVRLEMNDAEGAIEVLEKLVKLNPDREDYRGYLEELKRD